MNALCKIKVHSDLSRIVEAVVQSVLCTLAEKLPDLFALMKTFLPSNMINDTIVAQQVSNALEHQGLFR